MPEFDITEKTIDFVGKSIIDMAGNAGQETLIKMLLDQMDNGYCVVNVTLEGREVDIQSRMELDFYSPHEDAISEIIDKAQQNAELFAAQAEIPGPWAFEDALLTGNWKVVGYDQ